MSGLTFDNKDGKWPLSASARLLDVLDGLRNCRMDVCFLDLIEGVLNKRLMPLQLRLRMVVVDMSVKMRNKSV